MTSEIKKIVVVGGGLIAWWAAVFLKKTVPDVVITVLNVNSENAYADVTEKDFAYLLKIIGLSDIQLVKHADANFLGAQSYFNWSEPDAHYFHSAKTQGLTLDSVEFNQWLLKLKLAGDLSKIDDYLLQSAAARQGKVAISLDGKKMEGGLSFDRTSFLSFLKNYAKSQGTFVIDGEIKAVNLSGDGSINTIVASNGDTLMGDFFVDATGAKASLIGSALHQGYESWQKYLPCNRKRIITSAPRSQRLVPFTSVQLISLGWVKNIPLRSQIISQLTYFDSVTDRDMESDSTAKIFKNCEELVFSPGIRKKMWDKNCLALGEAAVSVDYFTHSPFYLAAVSLKRFIDLWPAANRSLAVEHEFNRLMRLEFEMVRDFHCLHYALANKSQTPFEKTIQALEMPESLRERVSLFIDCGRVWQEESTLISPSDWINLCVGLGCWPQSYDYSARDESVEKYKKWAGSIRSDVQKSVDELPSYTSYINTLLRSNLDYVR